MSSFTFNEEINYMRCQSMSTFYSWPTEGVRVVALALNSRRPRFCPALPTSPAVFLYELNSLILACVSFAILLHRFIEQLNSSNRMSSGPCVRKKTDDTICKQNISEDIVKKIDTLFIRTRSAPCAHTLFIPAIVPYLLYSTRSSLKSSS